MKNLIFSLIGIIIFITSCSKNYDSDLQGRWQLKTEISTNNRTTQIDSIFYSFDNNVVSVQKVERPTFTRLVFGKFTQANDSLYFDYVDWDFWNLGVNKKYFGILYPSEHYLIVLLNASNLRIRSKDRELIFRKF